MKNQIYTLVEGNFTLRTFLIDILFEEQSWLTPDTYLKNPERFVFQESKCLCTQYFGVGREGSNYAVEGKTLYYKDPRFKAAFNKAIDLTVKHLDSLKIK